MKSNLSRRRLVAGAAAALVAAPFVRRAQAAFDERMLGEMLILGFHGANPEAASARGLARHLAAGRVGGVCFLGHNTRNRAGIEGLTKLFHASAARSKPLICVDQEGGAVQRLGARSGYEAIPSAQAVAARNGPEEA